MCFGEMAEQEQIPPPGKQDGVEATENGSTPGEGNGSEAVELHLDLTRQEKHRGVRAGDTYVRVVRPHGHLFKKVAPGVLRATERASEGRTSGGRAYRKVKRVLIGEQLPNQAEATERLTKVKGLAIFASDAMSSVAYATEEILLVLSLAAVSGGLGYAIPISMAIAIMLGVVAFSYRQTVFAYPNGGGSYIVSRENLGVTPGLIAAAALTLDYILTVAVSVAAGTAALTSAFEVLHPYSVPIALAFIALMVVGNLRGIRESGNIFALPTYVFIVSLASLIVVGITRWVLGVPPVEAPPPSPIPGLEAVSLWLLARAFSSGSVAASGIEAIANGVPAFKPPESKNAAQTLVVMAAILSVFFLGISFLTTVYGVVPVHGETVLSILARAVFGTNVVYYVIQFATMTILVLAANTAFNGFPRLAWILAQDEFLPRQFRYRGSRLAYTYGISVLGGIAAVLIVLFNGETHALIPLYAVGVFVAFTLSQAGMVVYWRRHKPPGWKTNALINGVGAVLTGMVLLIAATTKFISGAWLTILMILLMVGIFMVIHRHYQKVNEQLRLSKKDMASPAMRQIVIVPVAGLNRASERALAFARGFEQQVYAVHVTEDADSAKELAEKLHTYDPNIKLIVLESPYRALVEPLLSYVDALHQQDPNAFVTVVLPEFLTAHRWQGFLHNGTAAQLNRALKPHPNVAVVNVPFVLEH